MDLSQKDYNRYRQKDLRAFLVTGSLAPDFKTGGMSQPPKMRSILKFCKCFGKISYSSETSEEGYIKTNSNDSREILDGFSSMRQTSNKY